MKFSGASAWGVVITTIVSGGEAFGETEGCRSLVPLVEGVPVRTMPLRQVDPAWGNSEAAKVVVVVSDSSSSELAKLVALLFDANKVRVQRESVARPSLGLMALVLIQPGDGTRLSWDEPLSSRPAGFDDVPKFAALSLARNEFSNGIELLAGALAGVLGEPKPEVSVVSMEKWTLLLRDGAIVAAVERGGDSFGVGPLAGAVYGEKITALAAPAGTQKFTIIRGRDASGNIVISFETADVLAEKGLIAVDRWLGDALIVLPYRSAANFTKQVLYPEWARCYLTVPTAEALFRATAMLRQLGHKFVVYDCYRPLGVQERMFEIVNNPRYVARPGPRGGHHNRGAGIDIGLADATGRPLDMPTPFDDFTLKAAAGATDGLEWHEIENRRRLQMVMERAGFKIMKTEWWHFVGPDASTAAALRDDFPRPEDTK